MLPLVISARSSMTEIRQPIWRIILAVLPLAQLALPLCYTLIAPDRPFASGNPERIEVQDNFSNTPHFRSASRLRQRLKTSAHNPDNVSYD